MNIKEILHHRHGLGLTRAQTETAVGVSTGTVSHILERASAAGLSWPLPDDLDEEGLRARLYPSVVRDAVCVQPAPSSTASTSRTWRASGTARSSASSSTASRG